MDGSGTAHGEGCVAWGSRSELVFLLFFFRPYGALSIFAPHPRLVPLRQAQGKLWAAFFRCFAAECNSEILISTLNAVLPIQQQRLGYTSSLT